MSVTSLQAMEVRTLQQTLTNQTQNTRKRKLESSGDRFYTVELPDEIWLLIFSKLNFQDLCRLMRVCTKFNGIAQDASLWKSLLYKHWEVSLKKTDLTPPLFVFRNFMQGTCAVNTMPLPLGTSCIQPISEKRVLCKSPKETISLYNLESKTSEDDPINLSEPITCIQMQDEKVLYGTQTHVVIFSLGPDEKTSDVVIKDFGIENLSKINGISISCLQILGNTLFVGNRHEILLLDLMERKHLGTLKHTSAQDQRHFKVTFMQASSTQLFVGSENGIFESWDYPEQKRLLRLKAHDKPVDCWQLLGSRLFLGSGQENII
ncbi:MAG TPA: F-box/WD40 repeat-containing protein, partial [Candidatus Babeliaceae bacterium]|nr:F-box/WD40 repeat-containing protein [Candidatus Babeliaceae bacterium]